MLYNIPIYPFIDLAGALLHAGLYIGNKKADRKILTMRSQLNLLL